MHLLRPLAFGLTVVASTGLALADHQNPFRLTVGASSAPAVGQSSSLFLRVYGPEGTQVRRFDDLHTKPMHLIAVSQDLEDFAHVHPQLSTWGYLTARLRFARATPYLLFAEFDPMGPTGEQTVRRALLPTGAQLKPAALDAGSAFTGSNTRRAQLGNTRVELVGAAGQRVRARVQTALHVRLEDPSGAPIGLTDYMGMPAHAIVVSEDLRDFMHLHAMVTSGSSGGSMIHDVGGAITPPTLPGSVVHDVGGNGGHGGHGGVTPSTDSTVHLMVEVTFPRSGLYKVWVQFQRGTTLVTAPFVVRASAP